MVALERSLAMRTITLLLAAVAVWQSAACDDENTNPPDQQLVDASVDGAAIDAEALPDSAPADQAPAETGPLPDGTTADLTPADAPPPDQPPDSPFPVDLSPDAAPPDLAPPDVTLDSPFPDLPPDMPPAPIGWSKGFGGMMPDIGRGISNDGQGGVLVTGRFGFTADLGQGIAISNGGNDIFAMRLSGAGQTVWASTFGGPSDDSGSDIVGDGQGGAFVLGGFQGTADLGLGNVTSAGSGDVFVIKLSSTGQPVWVKTYGGPVSDSATSIAADGQGNAVFVGAFEGTVDLGLGNVTSNGGRDIYVIKLTSSGQTTWVKTFGGPGNESAQGVDTDAQGVLVSGAFPGTVDFGTGPVTAKGMLDAYVVKLDGAGQTSWVRTYGGSGITYASGRAVGVDGQGGALVTGGFDGTVDLGQGNVSSSGGFDFYVTRLDSAGQTSWVRTYSGNGNDFGNGIASDGQGGAWVAGNYGGSIDLGTGTVNAQGLRDSFVTRLDSTGQTLSVTTFGAAADDDAADLAADGQGGALVTGYFAFSTDFGNGPIVSYGAADIFVLRIP
jgi:hypothetical protein